MKKLILVALLALVYSSSAFAGGLYDGIWSTPVDM
jgi:hypothetical protein